MTQWAIEECLYERFRLVTQQHADEIENTDLSPGSEQATDHALRMARLTRGL